ncbi:MAG TPA: Uma2 family endonuclease [Terriglobia bacterium]|jgi:Uma2 family endonuclease
MAHVRYDNAADWLHQLGDIPLERIIMDPAPGTATEADLQAFVERDKRLCELIDGTLVEKPAGYLESLIAGWLLTELNVFIGSRNLGYVSGADGMIRMISGRVRVPDVAFVSVHDLPGGVLPRDPIPTLPPTLAVEVLSETNTTAEIRQKLKEYFESGTKLAWIVDPVARTIAVFEHFSEHPARVLRETDTLDGGSVLSGFHLEVSRLFDRLPQ